MREPLIDRESDETPEQLELDVPAFQVCTCGATEARLCPFYGDPSEAGVSLDFARPRTCLRRVDPATTPWPEGY